VKSLFDEPTPEHPLKPQDPSQKALPKTPKEDTPLDRLKNLEEKIADAINKVKTLKEEKVFLERKIKELEEQLNERNLEVERLTSEKTLVKRQVEELLSELDTLELS